MKNKIQPHATRRRVRRLVNIAGHWLRGFWPIAVVVGAGFTVMREAVVDSILSTPHPALVYGIFAVAAAAVWLTAMALFRYIREESLLLRLQALPSTERMAELQGLRWRPDVFSVCYAILSENQSRETRLAAIEHELYAYEEHLTSTLTLPGYLSGALVGLGLVGTFVGLLGTLADLAGLFSAMTNMGGGNTDPVAMFTDMLNKLQAPMRSMGTAFVASLYGLLGSLVLGLVIYSVKRSGSTVLGQIRALIRLVDSERSDETALSAPTVASSVETALLKLVEEIRNDHAVLSKSLMSLAEDFQRHIQLANALATPLREGTVQVTLAPDSMAQLIELANLSRKNTPLLEGKKATDSVRQAGMYESAMTPGWLNPFKLPTARRATLAVVILCAVLAVVYGVMTRIQTKRSLSELNLSTTARDNKESATTSEVAPLTAPADKMQPPQGAVAVVIAQSPAASETSIKVSPRQSLGQIAAHAGLPLKVLISANPQIKDPNFLFVGQVIYLPKHRAAPARD